jgi:hypothetical protein
MTMRAIMSDRFINSVQIFEVGWTMSTRLWFSCAAAFFALANSGLSIPGSLFADLQDQGGLDGTEAVSFADSVREGSGNEGTEAPSAPKPRVLALGIMPLLGLSWSTGDAYDTGYIDKGSIFSFGAAVEAEYLLSQGWAVVSRLT